MMCIIKFAAIGMQKLKCMIIFLADSYLYDSAYISNPKLRGYSAEYSRQIFLFCQHVLICECDKPFDENLWKYISNNRYSARQWMKEYKKLKSNGELDFIKKYIKEEGD